MQGTAMEHMLIGFTGARVVVGARERKSKTQKPSGLLIRPLWLAASSMPLPFSVMTELRQPLQAT
jgi:hypothetical protein